MSNSTGWYNSDKMNSRTYVCSYCGKEICSEIGYFNTKYSGLSIYICHNCFSPTFFNSLAGDGQFPGPKFGKSFNLPIPADVKDLYEEARAAYGVNAFTAVGMCCRKLLMNICVDLGAKENLKFVEYVDYLDKENYIPKGSKKWVDIIRKKGNDATHEIKFLTKKDAEQMINFSAIIINLIYENDLAIDREG